jgi:hypothetical protein
MNSSVTIGAYQDAYNGINTWGCACSGWVVAMVRIGLSTTCGMGKSGEPGVPAGLKPSGRLRIVRNVL